MTLPSRLALIGWPSTGRNGSIRKTSESAAIRKHVHSRDVGVEASDHLSETFGQAADLASAVHIDRGIKVTVHNRFGAFCQGTADRIGMPLSPRPFGHVASRPIESVRETGRRSKSPVPPGTFMSLSFRDDARGRAGQAREQEAECFVVRYRGRVVVALHHNPSELLQSGHFFAGFDALDDAIESHIPA